MPSPSPSPTTGSTTTGDGLACHDGAWRGVSACRGLDPGLFFPTDDAEAAEAKQICARCEVRERCLDHALGSREREGVWGGLTERERRRIIRQRRRRRMS